MTTTHPTDRSRAAIGYAHRIELCQTRVTLNGRPAHISGATKPFANVTDAETGLSAQWAWATAAGIVSRGGAFKS